MDNSRFTYDISIYKGNPHIQRFDAICKKAFKYYHGVISSKDFSKYTIRDHLFFRFIYSAEATSSAIFLLINKGLILQASALCRVRLEQLIVVSYLINESVEKALEPFVYHMGVKKYRDAKMAYADHRIQPYVENNDKCDIKKLRDDADKAQLSVDSNYDSTTEKFSRKWTDLDLLSMAKARDSITRSIDSLSGKPLEVAYKGIYPLCSSFIHCDMFSISKDFMKIFTTNSNQPDVLMPDPNWALIDAGYCCMFDIVQLHEVLKYIGYDSTVFYKKLEDERVSVSQDAGLN